MSGVHGVRETRGHPCEFHPQHTAGMMHGEYGGVERAVAEEREIAGLKVRR